MRCVFRKFVSVLNKNETFEEKKRHDSIIAK